MENVHYKVQVQRESTGYQELGTKRKLETALAEIKKLLQDPDVRTVYIDRLDLADQRREE